jgi:hypothetical protein
MGVKNGGIPIGIDRKLTMRLFFMYLMYNPVFDSL